MTYEVLVLDMFHYMDRDEELVITGFPTMEAAVVYARARTWDSVEELRKPGQTHDELRFLWFMFGEDALVLDGHYSGNHEISYFIEHPASPSQRDWVSLEPPAICA